VKSRSTLLADALKCVCLITVLMLGSLAVAQRSRRGYVEPATQPSTQLTMLEPIQIPPAPNLDTQYEPLLRRSIFIKGRQRVEYNDGSRSTSLPSPVNPETLLVFVGVLQDDTGIAGYVEDTQAGQVLIVHVGDQIARGRIVGIDLDALQYESYRIIKTVPIGQTLAGTEAPVSSLLSSTQPSTQPSTLPSGPMSDLERRMRERRARGE